MTGLVMIGLVVRCRAATDAVGQQHCLYTGCRLEHGLRIRFAHTD